MLNISFQKQSFLGKSGSQFGIETPSQNSFWYQIVYHFIVFRKFCIYESFLLIASNYKSVSNAPSSSVNTSVEFLQVPKNPVAALPSSKNSDDDRDLFAIESFVTREKICINGLYYQIMNKIGKGGSSEVFRVIDEKNTIKALKKVRLKY